MRAKLLGPFAITLGDKSAGTWPRPSARRLCQLVLISPGHRIAREAACEGLFPTLGSAAAVRALSKTLSMARSALSHLGDPGRLLLEADKSHIFIRPGAPLEVDLEIQEEALSAALATEPGLERDSRLVAAVAEVGTLFDGEPQAEWAVRPRERLEWARQEARLALARDRAKGLGCSSPDSVAQAWETCLSHDPTCEEAASALMRLHAARGRPALVETAYRRCRTALEHLGLRISPALEEVHAATTSAAPLSLRPAETAEGVTSRRFPEERRLVSALFAELSGRAGFPRLDPEDLREVVGDAVAGLISEVEQLGGTVTSVSGAGLAALFGAPVSHEDDPERALRAAYRMLSVLGRSPALSLRVGVETGPAVVGTIGKGAWADYGAVGEVVGTAAALQSVAKHSAVLAGPVTRRATEGLFEWGGTEEVTVSAGAKPLVVSYVDKPKARPAGQASRRRLAGSAPLVGRQAEVSLLREAVRETTSGQGGVVLVVGEAGLGKTRLVYEGRKLFMAWAGAASGRLPLWLEGRAASYASSLPYGLYQQLLAAWVGVTPDEGEELARPALVAAMKAVFGEKVTDDQVGLLAQLMGLGPGKSGPALARLSPEELQRASFAALQAVVSRLVAHGPTVLVLEDLHWADPTSLRLTQELSGLAKQGPLLLMLTRRPEPDAGVPNLERALEADPDLPVRKLELLPLAGGAAHDLALALLGRATPPDVADIVSEGAEGNPLFLEERLSSLLETHALVQEEEGWRLRPGASAELPEALERLIRSRVDRLAPAPHEAIVAASVLGAEFGLAALSAVTELDGELAGAISDLCSTGLLVELRKEPEPTYRFRHALVQEAAYRGLLREQRRHLHARAAWGLENAARGRIDELAAVLGHHYAMAGEAQRAAHCLELAGDSAASAFANDEAIASYQYALAVLAGEGAGPARASGGRGPEAALGLRAKLGEVLLRTGRHAEARAALHEGLALAGADDRSRSARLEAVLGRVEIADHRYDAAMAAFDVADELIGEHPGVQDQATVDLWLEVQLDGRAYVHYWRNEPDQAAVVLAAARPVVEARGTPARRRTFHMNFALQRMRERRYRIDEECITNMRAAVAAAQEGGGERDIAFTLFGLGFCLLWHGELDAAQDNLEVSLVGAERTGDVVLRARCLCYLNVCALRRHDLGTVRTLAPKAEAAGATSSYPEYVGMAKATLAWLAWQEARPVDVVDLAMQALELWGATAPAYSWHWLCLFPLLSVRLAAGELGEAVESARQLLAPSQQRLPDELETTLQAAIAAWGTGDGQAAAAMLSDGVELAGQLRFA